MSKIKSFAYILALYLAFGFCGMALANTGDYSGDWQGSWWSVTGYSGGLSASVTQTGASLSGTASLFDTECGNFVGLSLWGTVYGNDTATIYTSAYCPLDGLNYEVVYESGAVSGNVISGTYTIYESGYYYYDSGTFSLTRTVNIITASAGPGGTISPSGTVRVNAGASQSFTITPTAGYSISDVLVDGVSVGAVPSYNFSNIQSNHTIAAYFILSAPAADFTANPTSGPFPLTVNFADQSAGQISSWSWDFGDSSSSTEQNPSHTYTDSGTYTVSLTVTGPLGSDIETKTDFIVARDASFSTAAAFAVLANMYSDSAMANAGNALDDPAYYPLAALYASLAYEYAEDAYEDATAALAAAQSYTFWGLYAPVYAESDIDVRYEAVNSINLAAQYAAQGDLDTAEYYLGYGNSLAATADLYNGVTIWCASMESSGQAAAQQTSASSEVEPSANGTSTFSSAATNAVLANMNFATSVTYGVSALDDPSDIPLVQLYASTAYDYAVAAYNDAAAALDAAGQDATFWGTYAVVYAEFDMSNKADALSAFDQAVQAYYAGDLGTAYYYLGYGFSLACLADLYNATTIWCASMESEGATK
jgi:PKD repeat protein